ncbi:MAG TPA: GNAT family N-acetyltransferase [Phyllobacterium sp.]|nr:GNAT family N-acetyltransferase [Phyllobacterium sp.]
MRFSGGIIRRTNSVNPLRGLREKPDAVIELAEKLYGSLGRKPIFRVPQIADDMDQCLTARGYDFDGGSAVRLCDLKAHSAVMPDEVLVERKMSDDWYGESNRISVSSGSDHDAVFRDMVATIVIPKAFTSIEADGRIVAKAYGAIHDGLLVLESVATDPAYRQRGYSRKVVSALMTWARTQGAEAACLQVLADNIPALALYASLGFNRELYRYHYRMKT